MGLYQVIDGVQIPLTWALDNQGRPILALLSGVQTTPMQQLVVNMGLSDLAENMGVDDSLRVNIVDRCMRSPSLLINDGDEMTNRPTVSVGISSVIDHIAPVNSPPIAYAYISTSLALLTLFRDQHAASPLPDFEGYQNSNQWYLTIEDMALVNPSAHGPIDKVIGLDTVHLEYLKQPQRKSKSWMNVTQGSLLKIDNSVSGFRDVSWRMTNGEFQTSVGSDFALYCFVVDIVGNCSGIVSDTIAITGPVSSFYSVEDIPYRRRVHRYRGPRESWKAIATSEEMAKSLNNIGYDMNRCIENLQRVSDASSAQISDVVRSIERLRIQRGLK